MMMEEDKSDEAACSGRRRRRTSAFFFSRSPHQRAHAQPTNNRNATQYPFVQHKLAQTLVLSLPRARDATFGPTSRQVLSVAGFPPTRARLHQPSRGPKNHPSQDLLTPSTHIYPLQHPHRAPFATRARASNSTTASSRLPPMATRRRHLPVFLVLLLPTLALANACSPYVDPCACGLCPNIVDCQKQQHKPECFCGGGNGRPPGAYPPPPAANATASTFFLCGERKGNVRVGVQMQCPYPLVFNGTQRACV